MIINYSFRKSRGQDNKLWGSSVNKTNFGFLPVGVVAAAPVNQTVVNTGLLQLPINCVLAGQQPEEKKSKFITDFYGILKNIFGE